MFEVFITKDTQGCVKQGSLTVECDSEDQAMAFILDVMDPFQNPIEE